MIRPPLLMRPQQRASIRPTARALCSMLQKTGLRRLKALLLLGAGFLHGGVLSDEEIASFVEVVDLVLENLELALLRAFCLFQLLQLRRLLSFLAFLRYHEL